ncbi:aminotransferase class III-fold pyridoxal phosphate-dependent enzyme [Paenibacillus sp. GCM10027626]|uniref:aminotransferase class III-fold pyridoxal phosphate-dependent enzyme n=1 Tax=Paenibacillus sp. GCM10027626 TaxID=3273411 RepID=UPI00363BA6C3
MLPASLTQQLYERAKRRIPGGVHLLSKRPEQMAPGQWPAYYHEARGCEVWDLDNRHYYDFSTNGIGSCLLGFRDEEVSRAAIRAIENGSMCTLNPPEEVELAERLCNIHPWAQQVKLTRGGGEACAVAVRIARATTGRSIVAICGYHGWHDWYLAANIGHSDALGGHLLSGLDPSGVPRELGGTAPVFSYNDREAFLSIMQQYGSQLACIIMEPCRYKDPEPGFLEFIRDEAHRGGALLIFDEITIGWRLTYGGAHMHLGITPDIAVFAKALGNGHPIGAVVGTAAAMEGAHHSFISSTYWTERVGPAAALAALARMEESDAAAYINTIGEQVKEIWSLNAARHSLPVEPGDGYACLANFRFRHELSEPLRTLFTQLMLERGFLAGTTVYPTLAHTEQIVRAYDEAVDESFAIIANALRENQVEQSLQGAVAHSGFRRLL